MVDVVDPLAPRTFAPAGMTAGEVAGTPVAPLEPIGPRSPGFTEQLSAAFALENPTVSVFRRLNEEPLPDRVEEGFNPYDYFSPAEIRHMGRLLDQIHSPEAAEEARRRLGTYEEQQRALADGPLPSWLVAMGASVLSLDSLLPLGWIAKGARAGRAGLLASGALTGAVAGAAAEIPLQLSQPFRTEAEGITNVLVGGMFGAALFGGVGALAARAQRSRLRPGEAAVEHALGLRDGTIHVNEETAAKRLAAAADPNAPTVDASTAARLDEVYGADRHGQGSVGAKMVETPGLQFILDEARLERTRLIAGKVLEPAFRFFGKFSLTAIPGVTLASSRFGTSRLFAHQFADVGLLPEAFRAQPLTRPEIESLVAKAQRKGFDVGFDEAAAFLENQTRTGGLALNDRAPVLNVIMAHEGQLNRMRLDRDEAYKVLVEDARAMGSVPPARDELDRMVAQAIRNDDPMAGRLGEDPLPIPEVYGRAVEQYRQALKHHMEEIGRRIEASGIRDDIKQQLGLDSVLREGEFLPKMFDRRAAQLRSGDLFRDLTRHFQKQLDEARGRMQAAEEAERAYAADVAIFKEQRARLLERAKEASADAKAAVRPEDREFHAMVAKDLRRLENLLGQIVSARLDRKNLMQRLEVALTAEEKGDMIAALRERAKSDPAAAQDLAKLEAVNTRVERVTSEAKSVQRLVETNLGHGRKLDITFPAAQKPQRYKEYEADQRTVKNLGVDEAGQSGVQRVARELTDEIVNGPIDSPPTLAGIRGSLRGRELNVDPIVFQPYLQTNVFQAAEQYATMMSRDLAVFEQFGDLKGTAQLQRLGEEHIAALEAAPAGPAGDAQRRAITKEYERDKEMITALIETARGQRGPHISQNPGVAQFGRNMAAIAYMARLGSMLYSQFADVARATMTYGASRFFGTILHEFGTGFEAVRSVDLKYRSRMGIGLDTAMLTTQRDLSDVSLMAQHGEGPVTRFIQRSARTFSWATLGPQWNDLIRRVGVVISEDMILKAAEQAANAAKRGEGGVLKLDRKTQDLLTSAGLDFDRLAKIGDLYERHGALRDPTAPKDANLRQSRYLEWMREDPESAQAFQQAVAFSAWKSLLHPTSVDTPLAFQNTVGTLLLQFKKFPLASTTRMLGRLAQEDAQTIMSTMVVGLAAGAASLALRDLGTKGKVEDRKPQEWAVKAVERSGLLGILFDIDTTASYAFGGNSLQKLLSGKDPQFKRGSQNFMGQVLGPTAGMAQDMVNTTTAATRWAAGGGAPSSVEVSKFRQLFPWQNHLLLRHGFDQWEQLMEDNIGALPSARTRRSTPPPSP